MAKKVICNDLVSVKTKGKDGKLKHSTVLAWGDEVDVIGKAGKFIEIATHQYVEKPDGTYEKMPVHGFIKGTSKLKDAESDDILKVSFVDVQQGDAVHIETPKGKTILMDGGDNQLFARYLASRYPGTSADGPKRIDAIIVTHGDADHFAGLTKIHESENNKNPKKALFIEPSRIFHNGIVKGPSQISKKKVPIQRIFGRTERFGKRLYLTQLEDDLLSVDKSRLNKPFAAWLGAVRAWDKRHSIAIKRLSYGDDEQFSFLQDEGIDMEVLGPLVEKKDGKDALPLLRQPPKSISKQLDEDEAGSYSMSHTINGHSIVLRLKYGNVRFLFAGDLNEESERKIIKMAEQHKIDLKSEILKVPHHGSAEFEPGLLKQISPVISIVSSGDESARKEYIHPRATMVAALGKYSRDGQPLIFVTELAAFFEVMGWSKPQVAKGKAGKLTKSGTYFGFRRSQFGIVHVRTDGKRILVYTHSGKKDLKEAYTYTVDQKGKVHLDKVVKR